MDTQAVEALNEVADASRKALRRQDPEAERLVEEGAAWFERLLAMPRVEDEALAHSQGAAMPIDEVLIFALTANKPG